MCSPALRGIRAGEFFCNTNLSAAVITPVTESDVSFNLVHPNEAGNS